MREPSPGFEHESEKLERAAIKRRRDEEIGWTPEIIEAVVKDVVRMKWTDIDKETK